MYAASQASFRASVRGPLLPPISPHHLHPPSVQALIFFRVKAWSSPQAFAPGGSGGGGGGGGGGDGHRGGGGRQHVIGARV